MKKVFKKDLKSGIHLTLDTERLKELCAETKIASTDQEAVVNIFGYLFDNSKTKVETKSIRQPNNFDLYFDNTVNTKGILFKDFTPLLQKPWKEIENSIEQWISEGKEGYLIDLLHEMNTFDSRERFEKITYIWITLVNRRIRTDHIIEDWINLISENRESIQRFYGEDREFFERLFLPNPKPFFYETYPIRILLRKYIDGKTGFFFPVSKIELQEICLKRLREFINSRTKFDVRVFNNFYYNCWRGKDYENRVIILEEANEILRKYIELYSEDYLRFVIRSKYTPHLDDQYVFEPFIPQYFGSWEIFKSFLNEIAKRETEFAEMTDYFAAFDKNGHDGFQSKTVPTWIEMDSDGNSSMKYFKDQTHEQFLSEMKNVKLVSQSNLKSDKIIESDDISLATMGFNKSISAKSILGEPEGTFSIWAEVSDKHNAIYPEQYFLYIVGYATNGGENLGNPSLAPYPNAWAILRIPPTKDNNYGVWRFWCNRSELDKIELDFSGALPSGWHLFSVAWSSKENYIRFVIDDMIVGTSEFISWPADLSKSITIGVWPNRSNNHYFNSHIGPWRFIPVGFNQDLIGQYYKTKPD